MEKRKSKPRNVFSPDQYEKTPRSYKFHEKVDERNKKGKYNRQRNVIATEGNHNKWAVYRQALTKWLGILRTQTHFVEVMTQKRRERTVSSSADLEITEVTRYLKKIDIAKRAILKIFHDIASENKGHRVFAELSAEGDESGLIDIDQVVCSLCGLDDMEGNDVLLCDMLGCCRAYHQQCLNPAVAINDDNDEDSDWFCWQCECIDDCLDLVNEQCETELWKWTDLFPEITQISNNNLFGLEGDLNSDSESDDSDDDDYNPEKEKMENQDNNDISDQGYDTDELSEEESDDNHNSNDVDEDNQREKSEDDDYYKFKQNNLMERDKKKTNRNEEDDEGNNNDRKKHGIEKEKEEEKEEGNGHDDNESDLEDDIDAEELNDLLHEAGSTLVPSGSMSVGGRLLRQRSSADREDSLEPELTVQGLLDIGKTVIKVKRGVLILGKIITYSPVLTDLASIVPLIEPVHTAECINGTDKSTESTDVRITQMTSSESNSLGSHTLLSKSEEHSLVPIVMDIEEYSCKENSPLNSGMVATKELKEDAEMNENILEPLRTSISSSSSPPTPNVNNVLEEHSMKIPSSSILTAFPLNETAVEVNVELEVDVEVDKVHIPVVMTNDLHINGENSIDKNNSSSDSNSDSNSNSMKIDNIIHGSDSNNNIGDYANHDSIDNNNKEEESPNVLKNQMSVKDLREESEIINLNLQQDLNNNNTENNSNKNDNKNVENMKIVSSSSTVQVPVSGVWGVLYEDGAEAILTELELRKNFRAVRENSLRLARSQKSALFPNELILEEGRLDASNVIQHKRSRKQIDYASLNVEMFGSIADDDPEAEGNEDNEINYDNIMKDKNESKIKKKRGRKPKIKDETPSKIKKVDIPFVFDHVLFQNCATIESVKNDEINE